MCMWVFFSFFLVSGIVFLVFYFFFNFWVCVLESEFVFLFKTHLDLKSYDF